MSSYIASHHLAVASQSGTKEQFYYTVYYKNLNSNCEAQWASKIFEKIVEEWVRSQK